MIDLTAHRPTQMNQILEGIATFIVCCKPDQIVRVAVDGVDGVGKTTFADKLGRVVELIGRTVIRSSVDGFHNPRELRYRRGRTSPEGFYFDSYDYPALRRYLLDPLGPGGSGLYRSVVFDHVTDSPVPVQTRVAPQGAALILEVYSFIARSCAARGILRYSSTRRLKSRSRAVQRAGQGGEDRPIQRLRRIDATSKVSRYTCARISRRPRRMW